MPGPLRTLQIWDTDISQEKQTGQACSPPNLFFSPVPPLTQDEYPNFSRGCQRNPKLDTLSKQFNLDNFLEWGSPCCLGKTTLAAHTSGEDTSTFPGRGIRLRIHLSWQRGVLQKQIKNSPNRSALLEWEVVSRGQSAQVQHSFWTENSVHVSKSESSYPLEKS